jgi:O-antigen ligase
VRDNLRVALGVFTVSTVAALCSRTRDALSAIRRGWILAVLLTLPVAGYEIATDVHLPHSYGQLESGGEESFAIRYAAVTFGHRNYYAAFLTLAFPFILWRFSLARSFRGKLMVGSLAMAVVFLVVLNASRLGMVLLVLQAGVWFVAGARRRKRVWLAVLAMVVMTLVLALTMLPYTVLRLQLLASGDDDSLTARTGLLRTGLGLIYSSGGLGVGAGGFSRRVAAAGVNTGGLVDPHNVWIEVLAQYGVLVGGAFIAWLSLCGLRLLRLRKQFPQGSETRGGLLCAILVLISLPLNGMMNSAYLSFTFFWVATAGLIAAANSAAAELRDGRLV